jgi:predicted Rossmann fold nucleotide-binding protein DprA/Smf involved in DNA uptake
MYDGMNIGVVGSRSFSDYQFLKERLYILLFGPDSPRTQELDEVKIISGGADGADSLAIQYAKESSLDWEEFLPEKDKYPGNSCYAIRNQKIVDSSDIIIAFWDGKSPGTRMTINMAKKQNKPVHIYWSNQIL